MARSPRRYEMYGAQFVESMKYQFVEAVRLAVRDALAIAIRNTVHDSSQAAFHWQVGIQGTTHPKDRFPGRGGLQDMRGISPVGKRGDKGSNANLVEADVVDRELTGVIQKYLKGGSFPTKIFLYNTVGGLDTAPEAGDRKSYAQNAQITAAGQAALDYALRSFQINFAMGNVRKRARKL